MDFDKLGLDLSSEGVKSVGGERFGIIMQVILFFLLSLTDGEIQALIGKASSF